MHRPHTQGVVITGVGVLAANGSGKQAFWETLIAGTSGVAPITLFDASDLPCRIAGEVKNFDPHPLIDPALKPKRMARFTQFGIVASDMAIQDAGLTSATLQKQRLLPVIMGVSTSAMDLAALPPRIHTAISGIPNAAASAIGYRYDLNMRLLTVSDGCASSLDAIATGAAMIRRGETDLVIAGGSEASITRYVVEIMLKCQKCSTRNEDPQGASRPFDKKRDYGVIAEGAGVVILENEETAQARGAAPYARIIGTASCADEKRGAEGCGMGRAMAMALENAARRPQHVDYISAHGPSDIHMDIEETQQIKHVLGDRAYDIPISSIKGVTGCPMGAGGVHQVIATCLSLREQQVPPTANYEHPDPACDLDYVPTVRRARLRTALINSHGFGRGNTSMLLETVRET